MGKTSMNYITKTINACSANAESRKICYMYIKKLKARLDQIDEHL